MAKKITEEIESKTETTSETITEPPKVEDVIVGVNPFKLVYSKLSADGKNGEKVEVITDHKNILVAVKVTEIVNGNVSVSVSATGTNIGTRLENGNVVFN